MNEVQQDNGPWMVVTWGEKVVLQSDDFNHDAALKITGDFACKRDTQKYAQMIADDLNEIAKLRLTSKLNELQCQRAEAEIAAAQQVHDHGQNGSYAFGVFAELDHDVQQVEQRLERHKIMEIRDVNDL